MLSLGPSRAPPGELPGHDPSFPSVTYGVPMCRFPFLLNQSAGSGACPGWMFSALHALGSAALGALLLSGCLGAPRVVSDWAGIELLEDGDVWTGRGYTVRTENVAALSADPGTVTPGKDPGTFVYHYPREKLADHSAVFPLAVDFSYETPEGKRFQRRLRLAEQVAPGGGVLREAEAEVVERGERADRADEQERENLTELYRLINRLGKLERALILLWLDERTYEEIAEILDISVSNVGVRINRIKAKLKSMSINQ